jgi:twitching motility protein PilT
MLAFDQHLAEKVRDKAVTMQVALDLCHSREELHRLVGGR